MLKNKKARQDKKSSRACTERDETRMMKQEKHGEGENANPKACQIWWRQCYRMDISTNQVLFFDD